jgi:hypothetical protein
METALMIYGNRLKATINFMKEILSRSWLPIVIPLAIGSLSKITAPKTELGTK